MSNPEYKFPWMDDDGKYDANQRVIKNVGHPSLAEEAEVKQHNHPLEDMEVTNEPEHGDFLTYEEGSGGGLVWRPGDISVEEEDTLVSDRVRTVNFEGQVSVEEDSGGKVTVNIAPGQYFGHDYTYDSSEGVSETNSIEWQDKLIHSTSEVLPAGTYRIAFYAELKISTSAQKYYVRYIVNGVEYCMSSGQNTGQEDYVMSAGFVNLITDTPAIQTFKVQWKSGSSQQTAYIRRARLEFWRIN